MQTLRRRGLFDMQHLKAYDSKRGIDSTLCSLKYTISISESISELRHRKLIKVDPRGTD